MTDVSQARNVLGTPVPRILTWNSRAQESAVGAEYIVMEKVSGIELEHVWPSMNIKDRLAIVKTLAGFQKAWTSISFTKFGSLYYAKDLDGTIRKEPLYIDAKGNSVTDGRFAIGPSMGRESYDNGRAAITFDKGPCKVFWGKKESS